MLPIRDTVRSRTRPVLTWLLIIANVLIFVYELSLSPRALDAQTYRFGLVPAFLKWNDPLTWYPLLSHMFLHGGWFHLISNMWILFIFGDNVEDRMGRTRFIIFYLLGGIVSGLVQAALSPDPFIPAIGASGAIAAVLGAYFLFYPRARILALVPIFFFGWFMEVRAVVFLGIWFVLQLYSGVISLGTMAMGGVAWWAHIGGFVFGVLAARLFARPLPPPPPYYPYYPTTIDGTFRDTP